MNARADRPIDTVRAMLGDLLGGPDASIAHRRAQAAVFAENQPPPPSSLRITSVDLGGVAAEAITPAGGDGRGCVLHLHGGGYVMGDPAGSRGFTTALALATGADVVSVDYRLAPAHPCPAALEDALAAYAALLARGTPAALMAIGGESAGGGLTLALLIAIREAGLPMPSCAFALSPWVDLGCAAASYESCAPRDPLLTRGVLLEMAGHYLNGLDASDPRASPLRADLAGLPPLLIQVGADEVLLDDAVSLADRLRDSDVPTDLEIWPDMIHVWQMFPGLLPEADEAIRRIAAFLKKRAWTAGHQAPLPARG